MDAYDMKLRIKNSLFFLAIVSLLSSSQANSENLFDVFKNSLGSDPQFKSAGAQNRASQEQGPQARANLLPEASMSASKLYNSRDVRKSGSLTLGTTSFTNNTFSIDITQPIYRKDLLVNVDQTAVRIRQANAEYAFALQDLIIRVTEGYFEILSAMDQLEFAISERDATNQQLTQSQQRFEVGLIAITDVEEAKAGFDIANAGVIAAENAVDNASETLREITGQYYNSLSRLTTEAPLVKPKPARMEAWTEIALEQNLQLRAAREAADVARHGIKLQQAQHHPTLDLVASYTMSQTGGTSDTETSVIGLELNLPLFEGGEVISQTREARFLYQKALDDLEREQRAAQRAARNAYRGVVSGISRVQALQQAVVSTEAAYEAIQSGFQVGTRTSVDVLNAQRDRFEARRDHLQARYDYILEVLRLKQAAGTLNEDDLVEINNWLE